MSCVHACTCNPARDHPVLRQSPTNDLAVFSRLQIAMTNDPQGGQPANGCLLERPSLRQQAWCQYITKRVMHSQRWHGPRLGREKAMSLWVSGTRLRRIGREKSDEDIRDSGPREPSSISKHISSLVDAITSSEGIVSKAEK
jgi:hypothetical protein